MSPASRLFNSTVSRIVANFSIIEKYVSDWLRKLMGPGLGREKLIWKVSHKNHIIFDPKFNKCQLSEMELYINSISFPM